MCYVLICRFVSDDQLKLMSHAKYCLAVLWRGFDWEQDNDMLCFGQCNWPVRKIG